MKIECETCIKRKTPYCPTSIDCMATDDMPYYQNRIMLLEENQELKKQLEEYKKELAKADSITQSCIFNGKKESEISFRQCLNMLKELKQEKQEWINLLGMFKNQQKEFIEYLENEKDRLARECSNIYEDSLGKTRLVNEDIFNEANNILSKYKEIIGNDINVGTKGGKDEK